MRVVLKRNKKPKNRNIIGAKQARDYLRLYIKKFGRPPRSPRRW